MNQEKQNEEKIDLSGTLEDTDEDLKFQNEKQQSTQIFSPETPKIIQWVIKYSGGLVKDETQASYVLIGLIVLAVIISFFLVSGSGGEVKSLYGGGSNPQSSEFQ